MALEIRELPANDPWYSTGFIAGGNYSRKPSVDTKDKNSKPDSKNPKTESNESEKQEK